MSLTNNNTVKVSIKETSLFDIWSFMLSLQQSAIKFGWLFGAEDCSESNMKR